MFKILGITKKVETPTTYKACQTGNCPQQEPPPPVYIPPPPIPKPDQQQVGTGLELQTPKTDWLDVFLPGVLLVAAVALIVFAWRERTA